MSNRSIETMQEDAQYVLTPVAKLLLAAGVSPNKVQRALQSASRRSLRIAALDKGQSRTDAAKHSAAVAKQLASGQFVD